MKFNNLFQVLQMLVMLICTNVSAQNKSLAFFMLPSDSVYKEIKVIEADFNNDKETDYALLIKRCKVNKTIAGKINVYYGKPGIGNNYPEFSIYGVSNPDEYCHGLQHILVGDLNDDGFDDLVTGTNNFGLPQLDKGYVQIWFSASDGSGIDTNNTLLWYGKNSYSSFAAQMEIADVTGDHIFDLVVTARFESLLEGKTFVYIGGRSFDTIPDASLYSPDTYGLRLVTVDDFNGDKIKDILLLDYYMWRLDRQRLHVFFGGFPMQELPAAKTDIFGYDAIGTFDVNHDDVADIHIQNSSKQNDLQLFSGKQKFNFKEKEKLTNLPVFPVGKEIKYELKFSPKKM